MGSTSDSQDPLYYFYECVHLSVCLNAISFSAIAGDLEINYLSKLDFSFLFIWVSYIYKKFFFLLSLVLFFTWQIGINFFLVIDIFVNIVVNSTWITTVIIFKRESYAYLPNISNAIYVIYVVVKIVIEMTILTLIPSPEPLLWFFCYLWYWQV